MLWSKVFLRKQFMLMKGKEHNKFGISLLIPLFFLTSCGFRPLLSESQPATEALPQVKVAVIKDRVGQQLRNRLQDFMENQAPGSQARYVLHVHLTEGERETSFRIDLAPRRKELNIKATFRLVELGTGKTVFSNFSEAYSSFSLGPESDFAAYSGYVSKQDAQKRMVEILAQDIRLQVASFLSHIKAQNDETHAP